MLCVPHLLPAIHVAVDAVALATTGMERQDGGLTTDLNLRESRCAFINSFTMKCSSKFKLD